MPDSAPPTLRLCCALVLAAGLAGPASARAATSACGSAGGALASRTATADTTYEEGRTKGVEDARTRGEWGLALRGLLGGTLAGPVGATIAYRSIDEDVELSAEQRETLRTRDWRFAAGYRAGFTERLADRRRERALLGGIAGTGIFLAVVIHLVDLGGESADGLPPSETPN